MGPLVPDIITNELNFVVAFLVGLAFGYIVEQAGFSSSRKLTGLFYGTDFTVLRVFFTAGATAMAGVLLLAKLGLLDLGVIYVNPTFLQSAIVGGLIMGVGFVVGGYCPGTSLCGMGVGRLDAMVFVLGSFAGIFGFGELYPRLERFYLAGSKGDLTIPAALGVSPGVVLVVTILIAVGSFVAVGMIERRVNPASPMKDFPTVGHGLAAVAFVAVGIVIGAMPSTQDRLVARALAPPYRAAHPVNSMTADEVAFRILDNDVSLQIVDVRTEAEFRKASLPGAINLRTTDLFGRAARDVLMRGDRQTLFVGNGDDDATEAATLARELGAIRPAVLQGGLPAFTRTILDAPGALATPVGIDHDTWAFRLDAGPKIAALIKARGQSAMVKPKTKKITGGCGV